MSDEKVQSIGGEGRHTADSGDVEVTTYLKKAEMGDKSLAAPKETTEPPKREAIIVIDFGSQYSLLIARRIRECQVYCELVTHDTPWEKIAELNPKGFILSGGPSSVYEKTHPLPPPIFLKNTCPFWAFATVCKP